MLFIAPLEDERIVPNQFRIYDYLYKQIRCQDAEGRRSKCVEKYWYKAIVTEGRLICGFFDSGFESEHEFYTALGAMEKSTILV